MHKRILIIGLSLVIIGIGCNGDDATETEIVVPTGCEEKLRGDVYLAALYAYQGWAVGDHWENATMLALEEINGKGGIAGNSLGLIVCDTQGDKATGVGYAQAVANTRLVAAIIGASRSAVTLGNDVNDTGVCRTAADKQIVMISPGSTNPTIADIDDGNYCYRTCVSDAFQGAAWFHLMTALGKSNPYYAYDTADSYTRGLADAFNTTATAGGMTVSGKGYDITADDFGDQVVTDAAAAGADVIALALFDDAAAKVVDAWDTYDWGDAGRPIFVGGDGVPSLTPTSWTNLSGNIYTTYPGYPTSDTQAFADAYKAKFGSEWQEFDHSTYDAVYLLAGAMSLADDPTDKAAIQAALAEGKLQTGTKVTFSDGWDKIIAELTANGQVDYVGAAGNQDFDSKGDVIANIGVKIGQCDSLGTNCTFSSFDGNPCFNEAGPCQ